MSAMLGVVQKDRVHLMADAAIYDDAGVLLDMVQKIHDLPKANAVFSGRGDSSLFTALSIACAVVDYAGFDGFLENSSEIFDRFDQIMSDAPWGSENQIMVAGWSERLGEPVLLMRCAGIEGGGLESGVLYRLTEGGMCGGHLAGDSASFDVAAGIEAMESARQTPGNVAFAAGGDVDGYGIGGWIMHAVVTADRPATMAVVHEWPADTIGQKIQPLPMMQAAAA